VRSVRILIVDEDDFGRYCITSILKQHTGFQIVGEVSNNLEATEISAILKPDLVIVDVALPDSIGFQIAREIRKVSPASKIVFVNQLPNSALLNEARKVGAQGFVSKLNAASDLVPTLKTALAGK
jgi:DNA-binding NarL/FixJ family response regulator